MSKRHANKMPAVAMVGLCLSLLAIAFSLVAANSMSIGNNFIAFTTSVGAGYLFSWVLWTWVRS